jgi:hypothetical protein
MKVSILYLRNGVFVAKFQVLYRQLSAETVEKYENTIYGPTWNLNNMHEERYPFDCHVWCKSMTISGHIPLHVGAEIEQTVS